MGETTGAAARQSWDACPLCDSADRESYVRFDELEFVRCRRCGVVYKSVERTGLRPADFYEAAYFHGRRSARDRRFEHRVRKARRQILAALEVTEGRRLLDVGCSFGYVLEAARRLGLEAAGMDISEYAVGVCRERGYHAEVGGLESMPFADGELDVVVMKHVLEHTPSPRSALAEVRRVTAPGAAVVIAVPNLAYWKGLWRRRTYRYFRPDDLGRQHYVYYTPQTLGRLLETCGFRVAHASKALFYRRHARGAPLDLALEAGRFAGVLLGQAAASALRLRREAFVLAVRRDDRA